MEETETSDDSTLSNASDSSRDVDEVEDSAAVPAIQEVDMMKKFPLLPNQSGKYKGRLTVVLDMDETLIHSEFIDVLDTALYSQTKESAPDRFLEGVEPDKGILVHQRPFLNEFLEAMGRHFEPVVFTAANEDYASAVLDLIDPLNHITARLYRDSTSECQGTNFVKDLSRLGRDLTRVVLVDNNLLSFIACPNNGLPILDFFTDMTDRELPAVLNTLLELSNVADVRPLLRRTYGLRTRLRQQNQSLRFESDSSMDEAEDASTDLGMVEAS